MRFFWGTFCMLMPALAATLVAEERPGAVEYAIAIHGGAGVEPATLTAAERVDYETSLSAALKAGQKILSDGGTALDAVEQTVRLMEDDPLFNAGRGAVFNSVGTHELDASIMDGRTKACGGVAAVRTVRHPISLARLVMTETRHVLLVGDGAEQFADSLAGNPQIVRVDNSFFSTPKRLRDWQEAVRKQQERKKSPGGNKGTVGCVAFDKHGNLAAGTSTGGLTNKKFGRVGDTPIVGAGTYADNTTCAVSCTGTGEHFIRNVVAYQVSALMTYKELPLDKAARKLIFETLEPDVGGLIAVGRDGSISMPFNTPGMARGAADSAGRFEVKLGE